MISAGDAEDGARDLALLDDRLLVASCESGLLSAPWSTTKVELTEVPGPWSVDGAGVCQPSHVEVIDDVVALAGASELLFVRFCD